MLAVGPYVDVRGNGVVDIFGAQERWQQIGSEGTRLSLALSLK